MPEKRIMHFIILYQIQYEIKDFLTIFKAEAILLFAK